MMNDNPPRHSLFNFLGHVMEYHIFIAEGASGTSALYSTRAHFVKEGEKASTREHILQY